MIRHKSWDINEHATGRFHKDPETGLELPIIGATFQNGLNDIEPDGSFVPCNVGVSNVVQGVTHLRMNRGRMGELRFGNSGSGSPFLVKIKDKKLKGLSFQYMDAEGSAMELNEGKPRCVFDNGIVIESTPYYKGVRMDILVTDPLTAPFEYKFSSKTYGQEYTVSEENGGLTFRGMDRNPMFIRAPYAEDANGDIGTVTIHYLGMENNLHIFKKVVDEEWFRQAAAPVRIDPDVTIDDVSGTIKDLPISSYSSNTTKNFGAAPWLNCQRYAAGDTDTTNFLLYVDLNAYSGITVTSAKFGLDFYGVGGSNTFDYFKVLPDWIEGTANGAYQAGSSCWAYRISSTDNWGSAGCQGGADHAVIKDGSVTVTGVDSDFPLPLTNAIVQDWSDTPANNHGIINIKPSVQSGVYSVARSSESAVGNKPYFYMEWTEVPTFNPSWARNSNQIIGASQ